MPLDVHGCPACPHPAIGPAIIGSPDVNVNKRPALRVDDTGVHAACCGTNTWTATKGSMTVFINGKAAHRMGDQNRHCGGMGTLIEGSPNVIVGESMPGGSAAGGGGGGGGAGGAGGGASGAGGGAGGAAGAGGGGDTGAGALPGPGPAPAGNPPPGEQPPPGEEPPIDEHTLVIEAVLPDGKPAAFRRYAVTAADGAQRTGILDGDGRVRLDGLAAGDAELSFPDLDGRDWDKA